MSHQIAITAREISHDARGRTLQRVLACALTVGLSSLCALSTIAAQTGDVSAGWKYTGDVGATLDGDWLSGTGAPAVSGTTGAQLSLGVQRRASARALVGSAIRISSQPLRLSENGAHWDGGTITVTQLLGTVGVPLSRGSSMSSTLELSGGAAFLSGARTIAPFSTSGRLAPTADAGVVLGRGTSRSSTDTRSGFDFRSLSLVLRYDVMRVDPNGDATSTTLTQDAVAGWVGRVVIGMRVVR